jgi:hypothetical protein
MRFKLTFKVSNTGAVRAAACLAEQLGQYHAEQGILEVPDHIWALIQTPGSFFSARWRQLQTFAHIKPLITEQEVCQNDRVCCKN